MTDGSIRIDTKIDTKGLSKDLKTIVSKVDQGMKQANKIVNVALAGFTALAGTLVLASKKFADTTDRIDKMSQKVGMSRKTFQEWDYVLSQNGASIDGLGISMRTLAEDMANGGDKLSKLGIQLKKVNGEVKTQEEVFKETITAFQGLEQSAEKTALAQQIFGRSSLELAPLLNGSAKSTQELIDKANELGLVLGDDVVNSGVILTDLIDTLKRALDSLTNNALAPIIPMINDVVNSFIKWATEGDRLKNIISTAVNVITNAFTSGLIPAILTGIGVVKALNVVFAVLNAVMSANPVSLIIIGIGVLVSAIVMLYKNWDSFFSFMQVTIQTLISAHKIMGAEIKGALIVAFNTVKLAVIDLTLIIVDKLLGGIQALLDLAGKLPFVGDMFKGLSSNVDNLRNGLDEVREEAHRTNRELIDGAIAQKKAFVDAEREKIAEIKKARLERLAQLEEERRLSQAELEAERRKAEEEEQLRLEKLNGIEAELEALEKLGQVINNQYIQEEIIRKKQADGLLDNKEAMQQLLSSYEAVANSLYSMGATIGGDTEIDKALERYVGKIKQLRLDLEAESNKAGAEIPKSMSRGIEENSHSVFTEMKNIYGGVSAVVNTIVGTVKKIVSSFSSVLKQISKFSVADALNGFTEFTQSITNFFLKELPAIPNMVKQGEKIMKDFMQGILDNKDMILDSFRNIFKTIDSVFNNNKDIINATVGLLTDILGVVIENAHILLTAGLEIVMALTRGIVMNADKIIDGAFALIFALIDFVTRDIGEIVKLGITLVFAIIKGVLTNLPNLIKAIVEMIPEIAKAIIGAIPEIVLAFIKIYPLLVAEILLAKPRMVWAMMQMGVEMIKAFLEALSNFNLRDFFDTLGQAFYEGFGEMFKAFYNFGKMVIDGFIAGINFIGAQGIWNAIVGIFTGFINFFKNLFGIHSPSKLFADMGGNIIQGLINGILNVGAGLWNAVSGVFTGFVNSVQDVFNGLTNFMGGVFNTIGDGLNSAWKNATKVAEDIGQAVGNVATTVGQGIAGAVSTTANAVGNVASSIGKGIGGAVSSIGKGVGRFFGFAEGSPYIEQDQIAQIHQGERIIPKRFNESLMSGETIMMNPKSFSSILQGLQGGMSNPSINTLGNTVIKIVANIKGVMDVDGREIGRMAFQYVDDFAGVNYGS